MTIRMCVVVAAIGCGVVGCTYTKSSPASPSVTPAVQTAAASGVALEIVNGKAFCASMPPYGGDDADQPTGGCFASGLATRGEIETLIARYPQNTWGRDGHGFAWPEQLPDGTWHMAVSAPKER